MAISDPPKPADAAQDSPLAGPVTPGQATTGRAAIRAALAPLAAAGVAGGQGDLRRILAHVLGLAPDRLLLHLDDPLSPAQQAAFRAGLQARLARQPVAQIIGQRLFWGRSFRVTRDTLDPRPETESLIERALPLIQAQPCARLLDLGTGTGCIVLTLLAENPQATGLGVDLSAKALAVAQENGLRLGLQDRVAWAQSDWFSGLAGAFDLIVSNPPYIAADEMAGLAPEVRDWEPHLALSPGGDGLDAYRALAGGARAHLAPGGHLLVEIGPSQGQAVAGLFRAAGLEGVAIHPDVDGRDRVVIGQAPAEG